MTVDDLGQPVGAAVPGWRPAAVPPREAMVGRYSRVEPLDPGVHAADLFAANRLDPSGANWTYLPYGPFADLDGYRAWIEETCRGDDPMFFAVVDLATGTAVGVASYLRIAPEAGSIEVGHINYSPRLQRTRAGTEAMFLMMRQVFDGLGYRRYEWKLDDLNAASHAAARRLGFTFEGVHRQALVYKGRNRDTAWYSILDREWPGIRAGFEAWLDPGNFDDGGRQRTRLAVR